MSIRIHIYSTAKKMMSFEHYVVANNVQCQENFLTRLRYIVFVRLIFNKFFLDLENRNLLTVLHRMFFFSKPNRTFKYFFTKKRTVPFLAQFQINHRFFNFSCTVCLSKTCFCLFIFRIKKFCVFFLGIP